MQVYEEPIGGRQFFWADDVRSLARRVLPYVEEQSSGARTQQETADLIEVLERLADQTPDDGA